MKCSSTSIRMLPLSLSLEFCESLKLHNTTEDGNIYHEKSDIVRQYQGLIRKKNINNESVLEGPDNVASV